ncbi:MAG: gamma-glutamyltransferase family protein [Anaerolineales bacterium]|jgi:gamma-glutamyltranspeptidase/glutathione hydrolase|nr:gamma-glutamyltransferase family protein [Anaerolineales bacterium]
MNEHPPEFHSRRSSVYGRRGMVASSQPLATAAGLEILRQGGNAADAAIATAAALNVSEPTSTGLGGDMFALFYDAKTAQVTALNGSGRAPAGLTRERFLREGLSPALPPYHPYTATVPGACAGWCDLLERHGTLAMSAVLAPAIELAESGFPVSPLTSYFWQLGADRQLKTAPNGQELTLNGRGPQPGEIFRNPGLARTLRSIAEGGKKAFYEGQIAEAIADVLQKAGGAMTTADLAEHSSSWEEPASVTFGEYRIYECPPNGQGITALLAFNLLEGFDLAGRHPLSVERLHLEIESLRLAFADARWYISDPAFGSIPLAELLSKEYAAQRRKEIDPRRATLDQKRGTPAASSDTVYLCVVDESGNACSFINSNYMGFGTGIVPKGWGFSLQNRGHNFSLDPQHPNCLQPKKRPYHTIIPGLITRADGSLFGPFGVMGGFMQPQGHLQVGLGLLLDGLDPQSALDLPRFCIDIDHGEQGGAVLLEEGIPWRAAAELAARGHPVRPVSGWARATFGRGQIILRDSASGVLTGGSDPRADGLAMTLV